MRQLIDRDPFVNLPHNQSWYTRGVWPCRWIGLPDSEQPPFVSAYRKRFSLASGKIMRVHVSADERYELFLDGKRIGRGPERGDPRHWYFETYDLTLAPGDHCLVARVWAFGAKAPGAQMSLAPGFIFTPKETEDIQLLATGVAPWEAKKLEGYTFDDVTIPGTYFAVGSYLSIDGREFEWGFEQGEGGGWQAAVPQQQGANGDTRVEIDATHLLWPATLPPMLDKLVPPGKVRFVGQASSGSLRRLPVDGSRHLVDETTVWDDLLLGKKALRLPAHTARRVIVDLGNYYCAYPAVVLSGGASSQVRLGWAESLFNQTNGWSKGQRDEIEGKYFIGLADTFTTDGGEKRRFDTLWWRAGRYLEIYAATADSPLVIESISLRETRYPLEAESRFNASDARLDKMTPIAIRALQMCAHETYMDCPYYEQLMYVGDTRLEVLSTYVLTRDARLPRKALRMFDASRLPSGLTQSRYPSRVMQLIPPFSLWWIGMLYDFALWQDDPAFVTRMLPGVRGVIDFFLATLNAEGLAQAPKGWNFMDWVPSWESSIPPSWESGIPPDGDLGASGVINWLLALALTMAAQLEAWHGEAELEAKDRRLAGLLVSAITEKYWDEARGLFADDLAHTRFSEHAQCLAVLSEMLSEGKVERIAQGLTHDPDLARTTIYFTHYLFETYARLGAMEPFFDRLKLWFELEPQGFKTTFEMPEPNRSDCHGWGAHPLYHFYASILGIRPASPGFKTVRIHPQLGELTQVSGSLVHPRGMITVKFEKVGAGLRGSVELPGGVTGELTYAGKCLPLKEGAQAIDLVD